MIPAVVYDLVGSTVVGGLLGFRDRDSVGAIIRNSYWNWGAGHCVSAARLGMGHLPGAYGGRRPGGINNGNINIGNDINIGGGNNLVGNSKPWRPDPGSLSAGSG